MKTTVIKTIAILILLGLFAVLVVAGLSCGSRPTTAEDLERLQEENSVELTNPDVDHSEARTAVR
jgi:hypothetical protein